MSTQKANSSGKNSVLTGYNLSRRFWDFCFENPEKVRPAHGMIFYFMVEMCNRFAWKENFGFPTYHAMEATGIKSKTTYYSAFWDLEQWDFFKVIQKSKNANTANIITLFTVSNIGEVDGLITDSVGMSVLDETNVRLMVQKPDSTVPIDKQETIKKNKPIKSKPNKEITPPSKIEFIKYALLKDKTLDKEKLGFKYDSWKENDWHTNENPPKKILNWKSTLLNTIPFLGKTKSKGHDNGNTRKEERKVNGTTESDAYANLQGYGTR